jgi:hypothetical protein
VRAVTARSVAAVRMVDASVPSVTRLWRPARDDRDYPLGLPLLGAVARKP